jgi:hypothetical protein
MLLRETANNVRLGIVDVEPGQELRNLQQLSELRSQATEPQGRSARFFGGIRRNKSAEARAAFELEAAILPDPV